MNENFKLMDGESLQDYLERISQLKYECDLKWAEVASLVNKNFGTRFTEDSVRKRHQRCMGRENRVRIDDDILPQYCTEEELSALDQVKLERVKLADDRAQINALYRRISREDSIKEIAHILADSMNSQFKLPESRKECVAGTKEAILEISDWHYGIEIDNYWNRYNPDIAKQRIARLRDEVISICKKENIKKIHVVNLGDLIAGRIHLQLRVNSRFDVITQIMEVSELLAQMLSAFSNDFQVEYYDTLDNHSRLEPNLKESIALESLARITTWYLKERVKNITINDNTYGDDIITFSSIGHNVVGVHGDKDKPLKVIDNMTLMTQQHYDIVLTAHLHHFSCEEKNKTVLISNSSLMGTDEFAERLRLSAEPSQNLIVVTKENPVSCIYKINLN